MATEVGEKAPDFTLPSDSWDNKVSLEEKGARVLGISVDSPWSHKAWAEERGIGFPLLSDFGREVAEEYGVKHEAGFPERAYFVVDQEGVVRAKVEDSPGDQPEVEAVLQELEKAL
jgi:peroxiredoxin